MKKVMLATAIAAIAIGAAAGGYWFGHAQSAQNEPAAARKVLYYRNPMGQPDTSPVPKKDSMGMDYIPVYADEAQSSPQQGGAPNGRGAILYYRNPMGLPDTSPVPKKDSMGMEYIPVYANENANASGVVNVSPERIQQLGVRSEAVGTRMLARTIQSVGTVEADERRFYMVNTKFDGWIEKLDVNSTGQAVRRGEPLMEIYAPQLVSAQQEYLVAYRAQQNLSQASEDVQNSAHQLAAAALQRLQNWDISDDQIERLLSEGTTNRTLVIRSPADGVVLEKMAIAGAHFAAGDPLYRIADLGSVWVMADIFEQDLSELRPGQVAKIAVDAYPDSKFGGKVDFVYPTVKEETRTAKVRIVVANPGGRLKPGMYAKIALDAPLNSAPVLAVAESAVLDSGNRQIVLVDQGQGRYQPREVKLGPHADGYYAVLDGLKSGENVVVGANFLIDAESNLRAALQTFAPAQTPETGAR